MSLIIFVLMPLGWALSARLLQAAISLTFPSAGVRRAAVVFGRWSSWLLPALYYLMLFLDGEVSAKDGVRLFGSEELFGLLCVPYFAVPALILYVLAMYVIRDLLRGMHWLKGSPSAANGPMQGIDTTSKL